MANVRVTRSLSQNSAFGQKVLSNVATRTVKRLQPVMDDAVSRTNAIVKRELVTDRAPDRRRGGAHLYGSFRCVIEWNGKGFPIVLRMLSRAPGGAVNAQESGAKAHTMTGKRYVFPVAQRWAGGTPTASIPRATAYSRNKRGTPTVSTPKVDHPGNRPIRMMARGLEGAIQSAYGKAVTARRR